MKSCVCVLTAMGILLSACSGTARSPTLHNQGGDTSREEVRLRLPVPPTLRPLQAVVVSDAEETIVRERMCAEDELEVVTGEMWVAVLEANGYIAQLNAEGWKEDGPLSVRFRLGDLVGDIWANSSTAGCRSYVFRFAQVVDGSVSWTKSRFSDLEKDERIESRCIRFFPPDPRFPDSGDEYVRGDCSRGNVLDLTP